MFRYDVKVDHPIHRNAYPPVSPFLLQTRTRCELTPHHRPWFAQNAVYHQRHQLLWQSPFANCSTHFYCATNHPEEKRLIAHRDRAQPDVSPPTMLRQQASDHHTHQHANVLPASLWQQPTHNIALPAKSMPPVSTSALTHPTKQCLLIRCPIDLLLQTITENRIHMEMRINKGSGQQISLGI